ncbi:alcohol dehydrogenase-like protein [Xylariaceae sp. FL0594]|nr:alcohol dehydrogenase-like protein [Xylariaceae sp. FL0594]
MSTTAEVSIPKTHKACVYSDIGRCAIEVREVETPEPGPGEVLVKLTHSGVCHSDYGLMMNSWKHLPLPTPPGQIGGHEGLGHIVKLGDGAHKAGVRVGDRVGIKWVSSACLSCPPCVEGMEGICFNQKISGYYTPGTFQEYVIGPANYVTPVPSSLPGEIAAPMLCAGVTTYAALRKSGARAGQWVVVSGAGGGLGTVATSLAARGMGFRVVGVDAPEKRDGVLESGAEHFVDVSAFSDDGIGKEVKRLTGWGASAVIVCTSSNRAYAQALGMLRFGGTLVCVGMPEGEPVPIANAFPSRMVVQELRIVSSAVGNRADAAATLDMAARGDVVVRFPVRTVGLGDLQAVFEDMARGKIVGRVVLDFSKT